MYARLQTAWKLVSFGLFPEAFGMLMFGEPEQDQDIRNQNPAFASENFYDLTKALNLSSFDTHIKPNVTLRNPFDEDVDIDDRSRKVFIQIVAHPKHPVLEISLIGHFTDINLMLKQNPKNGIWQIDDACIVEHSQSMDDDAYIISIPCDNDDNGDYFLPKFVAAFQQAVPAILDGGPTAETQMFKLFKPLIDEIKDLERATLSHTIGDARTGGVIPEPR